jgi:hypothetical protein
MEDKLRMKKQDTAKVLGFIQAFQAFQACHKYASVAAMMHTYPVHDARWASVLLSCGARSTVNQKAGATQGMSPILAGTTVCTYHPGFQKRCFKHAFRLEPSSAGKCMMSCQTKQVGTMGYE